MGDYVIGHGRLITTDARDRYAALRSRFDAVGLEQRAAFLARYPGLRDADTLFATMPGLVAQAIEAAAGVAASALAENRVYHLSDEAIRADLLARVEADRATFDRLNDRYLAIVGQRAEAQARQAAAREDRARIVGGGFGVKGAAQGIAIAGAANAAFGLMHGLAGAVENGLAGFGDRRHKRALFDDPATSRDFADFLQRTMLLGCDLVAEQVNAARDETVYEPVSPEVAGRAAALTANAVAGRVPPADLPIVLEEALTLDPFADAPWRAWVDAFGDADGSVQRAAAALGVTAVERAKGEAMAARRAMLPLDTPEHCAAAIPELEALATRLGLDVAEERRTIERKAEELDRQRRTFNGVVYDTPEEAQAARLAHVASSRAEATAARGGPSGRTVNDPPDGVDEVPSERLARERRRPRILALMAMFPLPCALMVLHPVFNKAQRVGYLLWFLLWAVIFLGALGSATPEDVAGVIITWLMWVGVGSLVFSSAWPRDRSPARA